LTPRTGLFTADTWSLLAIYVRNFLINQLTLLPATTVAVAMAWLAVLAFGSGTYARAGEPDWFVGVASLAFLLLVDIAFTTIVASPRPIHERRAPAAAPGPDLGTRPFTFGIVLPLLLAALVGTYVFGVAETLSPATESAVQGPEGRDIRATRVITLANALLGNNRYTWLAVLA